jgi:small nuclear ribonucleoprotein (snRNP)-like protein
MNIALERCKEVSEGRVTRNWGDAFVRGNNGALALSKSLTTLAGN